MSFEPSRKIQAHPYARSLGVLTAHCSKLKDYTGTDVFLAGLKNGIFTTVAAAFSQTASIVISSCSLVPSFECSVSTLANAINFFSTGDHVVEVAFPTCRLPAYTGTCTREVWLGAL